MKIVEIFTSIQGEGIHQGKPCIFVRCAGCNLACSWCDTPYAQERDSGEYMAVPDVILRITQEKLTYACITGGEPLLQSEEVLTLCRQLHDRGFLIEIETNGTIDFSPLLMYASINMDVKCPSSGEEGLSKTNLISLLRPGDALTFVVRDREDCQFAKAIISQKKPACEVFFSPVEGSDGRDIAGFICEQNLPVRLELQLHKYIGIR